MTVQYASNTTKSNQVLMLNALGILLVVIGHSHGVLPHFQHTLANESWLYASFLVLIDVIYTFHMPLFFFISGYLFSYSGSGSNDSFLEFIFKKSKRLLLPYFIISSLTYPLKVILSSFALRPIEFGFIEYIMTLVIPWNNSIVFFWFLPTLFLIMVLAKVCFNYKKSFKRDVFILFLTIVTFFSFEHKNLSGLGAILNVGGALHNLVYFFAGAFLFKYYRLKIFVLHAAYLVVPFLVILISCMFFFSLKGSPIIGILLSFSGILFCFGIIRYLPNKLMVFGKYSYQIYLLSWFPQIFIRVVFGQVYFFNVWVSVALSIIVGLVFPIIASVIIKKIKSKKLSMAFGL